MADCGQQVPSYHSNDYSSLKIRGSVGNAQNAIAMFSISPAPQSVPGEACTYSAALSEPRAEPPLSASPEVRLTELSDRVKLPERD